MSLESVERKKQGFGSSRLYISDGGSRVRLKNRLTHGSQVAPNPHRILVSLCDDRQRLLSFCSLTFMYLWHAPTQAPESGGGGSVDPRHAASPPCEATTVPLRHDSGCWSSSQLRPTVWMSNTSVNKEEERFAYLVRLRLLHNRLHFSERSFTKDAFHLEVSKTCRLLLQLL